MDTAAGKTKHTIGAAGELARRATTSAQHAPDESGRVVETIDHLDGSLDLVIVAPNGELNLVRQRAPQPTPCGLCAWLRRLFLH